jgi:hypothetical protein
VSISSYDKLCAEQQATINARAKERRAAREIGIVDARRELEKEDRIARLDKIVADADRNPVSAIYRLCALVKELL